MNYELQADRATRERVEMLKEEGAKLLMSIDTEHSPAIARLRVIDEKINVLLNPFMPRKTASLL